MNRYIDKTGDLLSIRSDFTTIHDKHPQILVNQKQPLLLIDIDGTLVNAKKIHGAVIQEQYFNRFHVNVNPKHWFAVFGLGDRLEHAALMKRYKIQFNKKLIEVVCQEYARIFEDKIKKIPSHQYRSYLIPHALTFIQWAQNQKIPMAIVTGNVYKTANAMLRYLGLSKYFITGGFEDDPRVNQRSDIIRNALKKCSRKGLSSDPERTIIIGDTPHDAYSACQVNSRFKTVLVATGDYSLKLLKNTQKQRLIPPCEPLFCRNISDVKIALQRIKILV